MPAVHTLSLTEGLHAPSRARGWVSACTSHLPRESVEDALLVVSELVTNAVRHGGDHVAVTLRLPVEGDDEQDLASLRIDVHDDGEALPIVAAGRPSIDRATGRGLLIVAATASDWGVERSAGDPGKTVWASIAVARG